MRGKQCYWDRLLKSKSQHTPFIKHYRKADMCRDPAISYTLQPPMKCHCLYLLNEPPGAFPACPSTITWAHLPQQQQQQTKPPSL